MAICSICSYPSGITKTKKYKIEHGMKFESKDCIYANEESCSNEIIALPQIVKCLPIHIQFSLVNSNLTVQRDLISVMSTII